MRLRWFGNRAIVLDAARETIPEKVTVAELLQQNRRRWFQGPVAPADANKMEHDALRLMNKRNRDFWAVK